MLRCTIPSLNVSLGLFGVKFWLENFGRYGKSSNSSCNQSPFSCNQSPFSCNQSTFLCSISNFSSFWLHNNRQYSTSTNLFLFKRDYLHQLLVSWVQPSACRCLNTKDTNGKDGSSWFQCVLDSIDNDIDAKAKEKDHQWQILFSISLWHGFDKYSMFILCYIYLCTKHKQFSGLMTYAMFYSWHWYVDGLGQRISQCFVLYFYSLQVYADQIFL